MCKVVFEDPIMASKRSSSLAASYVTASYKTSFLVNEGSSSLGSFYKYLAASLVLIHCQSYSWPPHLIFKAPNLNIHMNSLSLVSPRSKIAKNTILVTPTELQIFNTKEIIDSKKSWREQQLIVEGWVSVLW